MLLFNWYYDKPLTFTWIQLGHLTLSPNVFQLDSHVGLEHCVKPDTPATSVLRANRNFKLWPSDLNLNTSPAKGVSAQWSPAAHSPLRSAFNFSDPCGPGRWTSPKTKCSPPHHISFPLLCSALLSVLCCLQEGWISLALQSLHKLLY